MTPATAYDAAIYETLNELQSLAADLAGPFYRTYTVTWTPGQESHFALVEQDDCDGWPMRHYSTAEECRADIQALVWDPSPLEKGRNPATLEIERLKDEQGCW